MIRPYPLLPFSLYLTTNSRPGWQPLFSLRPLPHPITPSGDIPYPLSLHFLALVVITFSPNRSQTCPHPSQAHPFMVITTLMVSQNHVLQRPQVTHHKQCLHHQHRLRWLQRWRLSLPSVTPRPFPPQVSPLYLAFTEAHTRHQTVWHLQWQPYLQMISRMNGECMIHTLPSVLIGNPLIRRNQGPAITLILPCPLPLNQVPDGNTMIFICHSSLYLYQSLSCSSVVFVSSLVSLISS